jgi:hypothetical protein
MKSLPSLLRPALRCSLLLLNLLLVPMLLLLLLLLLILLLLCLLPLLNQGFVQPAPQPPPLTRRPSPGRPAGQPPLAGSPLGWRG